MDPLRRVAKEDGRYRLQAYQFLFDALDATVRITGKVEEKGPEKHVTGRELLEGMRQYASQLFGPLAAQVWRSWGVKSTDDWGHIVFNLVENEMLRRQDSDTIEDFKGGYDFEDVFVRAYKPMLPGELDAVPRPPTADSDGPQPS